MPHPQPNKQQGCGGGDRSRSSTSRVMPHFSATSSALFAPAVSPSLEGIKFKPETYRKEQGMEDEKLTREMGAENQRLHSPTGRDKGAEWVACGGKGPEIQLPLELPTVF